MTHERGRCTFWVPGKPRPKGSLVIMPRPGARPAVIKGQRYYRLEDLQLQPPNSIRDAERVNLLGTWTKAIQWAAIEHKPKSPLPGPFAVECMFHLKKPERTKYDELPLGPPDVDKLERAVGDALTGKFWRDDSQVYRWVAEKQWSDQDGANVTIVHRSEQTELF